MYNSFVGYESKKEEFYNAQDKITSNDWITNYGYSYLTMKQLYITSIYFVITTITTVGYGDITGTNSVEMPINSIL